MVHIRQYIIKKKLIKEFSTNNFYKTKKIQVQQVNSAGKIAVKKYTRTKNTLFPIL